MHIGKGSFNKIALKKIVLNNILQSKQFLLLEFLNLIHNFNFSGFVRFFEFLG